MSLLVIYLLSLYVTNMFLCFVHVFIKCSLESHAWHFFPLFAPLLLLFSVSACNSNLFSPHWCSVHWSSFLWFESVSLCCFCSLCPFSSLILYCFATYCLDLFNVSIVLVVWSFVSKYAIPTLPTVSSALFLISNFVSPPSCFINSLNLPSFIVFPVHSTALKSTSHFLP